MTRFRSRRPAQVAFAAPRPGKLKQLDLDGSRASGVRDIGNIFGGNE